MRIGGWLLCVASRVTVYGGYRGFGGFGHHFGKRSADTTETNIIRSNTDNVVGLSANQPSTRYLYGGHYVPYIHPDHFAHVLGKRSANASPNPDASPLFFDLGVGRYGHYGGGHGGYGLFVDKTYSTHGHGHGHGHHHVSHHSNHNHHSSHHHSPHHHGVTHHGVSHHHHHKRSANPLFGIFAGLTNNHHYHGYSGHHHNRHHHSYHGYGHHGHHHSHGYHH